MFTRKIFKYFTSLLFLIMSCTPLVPDSNNYAEWSGWQETPPEIFIEVSAATEIVPTDSLYFQIIIINKSNKDLTIGAGKSFTNQLEFDLTVVNQEEQIVWSRFPDNANYTSEMYTIHLEPGENYEMEGVWHLKDKNGHKISRGEYKLFGGLHGLEILTMKNGKTIKTKNFGHNPVGSDPLLIQVK